jgi:hypothetical protein
MRPFRQCSTAASLLALVAQVEAMINETINSQVRLAYVANTGMRVSWNTFTKEKTPTVLYGTSPKLLTKCATSTDSVTYDTSLTYNNHVTITGLKPDTTYYYLPSHLLEDDTVKAPYSFRTSRAAGNTTPYSMAIVIDLGTMGPKGLTTSAGQSVNPSNILQPGQNNTMQSMEAVLDDIDFVLHRKPMTLPSETQITNASN